MGAPDFPRRLLADKFLYRALIRINDYKCAKFQLPSSIWRLSQTKNWEMLISSVADKFLHVATVLEMPISVPNFNFLAPLVSEIWGCPKLKSGSFRFPQTPTSGQIFISNASTRKCAKFQFPVEPILSRDISTYAYSRRVVPMSLWEIYIPITAWCIKIRRWN